jgi:hypothetical protein
MCASVTVVAPRPVGYPISVSRLTNSNNSERPVMTSGMMSGAEIMPENKVRPLKRPSRASVRPASVPRSVAKLAETTAICRDRSVPLITWSFASSLPYHWVENPPQTVASLDELNDYSI